MIPNTDDPTKMKPFRYVTPTSNAPKTLTWLARTEWMVCAVQKVGSGGESVLHYHAHLDGFWFVLKGRAKFYSDYTELLAELGPNEGVLVPRGVKYWFESSGSEPLEILQVESSSIPMRTPQRVKADRVDYPSHPKAASPSPSETT